MQSQIVIGSINPAMSAIFAIALFAVWTYQRHHPYIAVLGVAYATKTVAFVVQQIAMQQQVLPLRILSTTLFMVTASLVAIAIAMRFGQTRRIAMLASISLATIVALGWNLLVEDNFVARVVAINLGLVAITGLMAAGVARIRERSLVEQFLLVQIVLNLIGFLSRPLTLLIPGSDASNPDSPYWVVVSVSDILLSMMLTLAIFAVIAVDVVAKLKSETILDPLSGLLNRRGFDSLALEVVQARGAVRPVLVLTDLDHFKAINDRFGHAAGDRVIRRFGEILKEEAPEGAIVGRVGGEEFAVLLVRADGALARLYAEAARNRLAFGGHATFPDDLRATASFGIATARPGEDLSMLLERADAALYRAKEEGRDRVRMAADGPAETAPSALPHALRR